MFKRCVRPVPEVVGQFRPQPPHLCATSKFLRKFAGRVPSSRYGRQRSRADSSHDGQGESLPTDVDGALRFAICQETAPRLSLPRRGESARTMLRLVAHAETPFWKCQSRGIAVRVVSTLARKGIVQSLHCSIWILEACRLPINFKSPGA